MHDWLHRDYDYINAHIEMMPIIEAEETLRNREIIACGTGSMDKEDQRKFLNRMDKQSRGRTVKPLQTKEQRAYALSAMGLSVTKVKMKKRKEPWLKT